jgi:SAM-dependent methyltransferase
LLSLDAAESLVTQVNRTSVSHRLKAWFRRALPLAVRKQIALLAVRQKWLPERDWWALEMIRDWSLHDTSEFHRFLWRHHLAYARTYEIEQRFGIEHIHPSRFILFDELAAVLSKRQHKVDSVLEVGCSMGYLLRHVEECVFSQAGVIDGIDIDAYAIERGAQHLRQLGSRVRLQQADMAQLPHVFGGTRYDLILCAGVLMYVAEDEALEVVRAMLARCNGVVALAGLAHPKQDNSTLSYSVPREADQSFIHNLDALVKRAGGKVIARRWDGERKVNGNTIYFVFAEPGQPAPASPPDSYGE